MRDALRILVLCAFVAGAWAQSNADYGVLVNITGAQSASDVVNDALQQQTLFRQLSGLGQVSGMMDSTSENMHNVFEYLQDAAYAAANNVTYAMLGNSSFVFDYQLLGAHCDTQQPDATSTLNRSIALNDTAAQADIAARYPGYTLAISMDVVARGKCLLGIMMLPYGGRVMGCLLGSQNAGTASGLMAEAMSVFTELITLDALNQNTVTQAAEMNNGTSVPTLNVTNTPISNMMTLMEDAAHRILVLGTNFLTSTTLADLNLITVPAIAGYDTPPYPSTECFYYPNSTDYIGSGWCRMHGPNTVIDAGYASVAMRPDLRVRETFADPTYPSYQYLANLTAASPPTWMSTSAQSTAASTDLQAFAGVFSAGHLLIQPQTSVSVNTTSFNFTQAIAQSGIAGGATVQNLKVNSTYLVQLAGTVVFNGFVGVPLVQDGTLLWLDGTVGCGANSVKFLLQTSTQIDLLCTAQSTVMPIALACGDTVCSDTTVTMTVRVQEIRTSAS